MEVHLMRHATCTHQACNMPMARNQSTTSIRCLATIVTRTAIHPMRAYQSNAYIQHALCRVRPTAHSMQLETYQDIHMDKCSESDCSQVPGLTMLTARSGTGLVAGIVAGWQYTTTTK